MNQSPTTDRAITLLGGGMLAQGALERALQRAPRLVAVDSGADRALAAGVIPELVIGDFDSISPHARRAIAADRQLHRPGQEDTDFDKALAHVLAHGGAPFMLALGFTGGRLDHTLAGMSTLLRNPGAPVLMDAGEDLCFLCPPLLRLALAPGSRLSLYPMRPVRCASQGLHWPTDALLFDPGGMIGTSNRVAAERVELRPDRPALLVMLPSQSLDAAISALTGAPRWPASHGRDG
ncbi:MAG: thiamine diphosphokinase [Pararhodobacter sp.]|nr:thiamine diphosphokinase [Pararhodobacter sp.]